MSTDFSIQPVRSKSDLKRFINYPYVLYKDNPYWVPPLRVDVQETLSPKKNPFYEHGRIQCFLALDKNGTILGRIAGIVNGMHLEKYDDGNGFFGFFECDERYDVAEALLEAAREWLTGNGLTGMRGPTNPSMNDVAGLLVDGFDRPPSVMMAYNPPYYEDFLTRYGFRRAMTMWAYFAHYKMVRDPERFKRGLALLYKRNPGLKLRRLDMTRFDEDAKSILEIYNDAWSNNWGHVPMTENEFAHLAKSMKQIVDPKIVYFLELDGKPIGFSVSLPNINLILKHIKNGKLLPFGIFQLLIRMKFAEVGDARTLLMGVLREYQGRGFDTILNAESIFDMPKQGYPGSEMSWVLDSNPLMINAMERMGGAKDKEYAMFEVSFEGK